MTWKASNIQYARMMVLYVSMSVFYQKCLETTAFCENVSDIMHMMCAR